MVEEEAKLAEGKVADAFGAIVADTKAAAAKVAPQAQGILAQGQGRRRGGGQLGCAPPPPRLSSARPEWWTGLTATKSKTVVSAIAAIVLGCYTYHLGEQAVHARAAVVAAQAAARKTEHDDAVVQAALADANRRHGNDVVEIARLNAMVARAPATRICPTVVLDTIHSLGGRK